MKPEEFPLEEMEKFPYARILADHNLEDRREYHAKDLWELEIKQLLPKIDPVDYFRTTGEATIKLKKLEHDLFALIGSVKRISHTLDKLKGDNAYLETQWIDGHLLMKIKNPRKNKEFKMAALEENFAYGSKKKRETKSESGTTEAESGTTESSETT